MKYFAILFILSSFASNGFADDSRYHCSFIKEAGLTTKVLKKVTVTNSIGASAKVDVEALLTGKIAEDINGTKVSDYSSVDEITYKVEKDGLKMVIKDQDGILAEGYVSQKMGSAKLSYQSWHMVDDYDHSAFTTSEFQVLCNFDLDAG